MVQMPVTPATAQERPAYRSPETSADGVVRFRLWARWRRQCW